MRAKLLASLQVLCRAIEIIFLQVQLAHAPGDQVGEVYAYGGKVSWVFMTVDASRDNDAYTCVLDLTGGEHQVLGWFGVEGNTGSWGRTVDIDIRRVVGVRLVTKAGATAAWATFS